MRDLRDALDARALLVLERRSCRTVFIFRDGVEPAAVAKIPRPGDASIEREHRLLQRVAGAGVGPSPLPPREILDRGTVFLQQFIAGHPLRVDLTGDEGRLEWTPQLEGAAEGLLQLAFHTKGRFDRTDIEAGMTVADTSEVSPAARETVRRSLEALPEYGVVRHGDTSPQNVLVEGNVVRGMVDWESAVEGGAPGFDMLNLAVAAFERAVVVRTTSWRAIPDAFARSWGRAHYWEKARESAQEAAAAAGCGHNYQDHVVQLFFARRLGRRMGGSHHPRAGQVARACLEVVCER